MSVARRGTIHARHDPEEVEHLTKKAAIARKTSVAVILAKPKAEGKGFMSMSPEERLIIITFCVANFATGCFYSMLGPFFPTEAAKKGVNSTYTGLIFGCYELVIVIFSPIFGKFMKHLGPKPLFVTGMLVCGVTSVLFGFLDQCPGGTIYIVMCFSVRSVEAIGAAAFTTASFTIMAYTFPANVATMYGILELFSGIGMMIGPPLGGALFSAGGFKLPFILMGVLLAIAGLLSIRLLPKPEDRADGEQEAGATPFQVVVIPVVVIMCLHLLIGSAALAFVEVTLAVYLQTQFNVTSPLIMGVIFLVGPGVYAAAAPFWGWLSDKKKSYAKGMLIFGYIVAGVSYILMGPAPELPIPKMLWLVIVSLGLMGFGVGTLVISFPILTDAVSAKGYPDNIATYGAISGVFNTFFSLGAFIGPLGGGALNDLLHFPLTSAIMGLALIGCAVIFIIYIIIEKVCCPASITENVNERSKLIQESASSEKYSA